MKKEFITNEIKEILNDENKVCFEISLLLKYFKNK